ncbi:quinoprotein relay system zinc metallohydrolase 1 [Neptunomonas sp. XY-337]|uniref:quinoprotein relay system zinc metallohydrolase 1 n=1 Tax=Neptunomonas sp. XY-337 TaxID=2561897 RepID=UPI0010AA4C94|nr:quinoprotein relay system zinc metallohydrolase 1 [Neptunomonas sp. XY-337]
MIIRWLLSVLVFGAAQVSAAPLTYNLKAQLIAPNTYVLQGKLEDFSRENGGNIVNTGFIVTEEGVVVIDTGPSLRYGRALREVIKQTTDQPIKLVLNTHHHPDHFLGNQAFSDVDIYALKQTSEQIAQHGDAFAENMYRLVGDWMRSTEVEVPRKVITESEITLGSHRLALMPFSGHSGADLVIKDHKTGVVFAADMVFYQRALTTPHTPGLAIWLEQITELGELDYTVMVPGHGPLIEDGRAIAQMQSYLRWLDQSLTKAAQAGLSMTEVMKTPIKAEFAELALSRREFARTVAHLYPKYEEANF